jgi:hypothetical protein
MSTTIPFEVTPREALDTLEILVGTWSVSGPEIEGQVQFEWMEGGAFLMQRVDLMHDGHWHKGIEVIGYDEDSGSLRSRYYGNVGIELEYEWEIDGSALTIWFGRRGSDNRFEALISYDGDSIVGAWAWPGGGYRATMTRIEANG